MSRNSTLISEDTLRAIPSVYMESKHRESKQERYASAMKAIISCLIVCALLSALLSELNLGFFQWSAGIEFLPATLTSAYEVFGPMVRTVLLIALVYLGIKWGIDDFAYDEQKK